MSIILDLSPLVRLGEVVAVGEIVFASVVKIEVEGEVNVGNLARFETGQEFPFLGIYPP